MVVADSEDLRFLDDCGPADFSLGTMDCGSLRSLGNLLDERRSGGVGGGGDRRLRGLVWPASELSTRSPPLTVDEDEEDVKDSRTAGRPCTSLESPSREAPPIFRLVTGGRLLVGLIGLTLEADLGGSGIPGE